MINKIEIAFDEVKELSQRDIDYQLHTEKFSDFISHYPNLDDFKSAIELKSKQGVARETLVAILKEQYKAAEISEALRANLEGLATDHGFCVTTAHQPSLMTGPLYYIYKIISTIRLSHELKHRYPAYHFTPVFVSGGEDHDFEEVNHFNLFGKKIIWDSKQGGSVGRFTMEDLKPVISELTDLLGTGEFADELKIIIKKATNESSKYSDFVFRFVHSIFGRFGLVIVNMDHSSFKEQLKTVFWDELTQSTSKKLVEDSQEDLAELGYKAKAFARKINLFYLSQGSRERIVLENDRFRILNTHISFSHEEIKHELGLHPENFSPNVIMRPLFQEWVLPNLAYIGGGGEISYWLERKKQFKHYGIPFPVLMRRNSVLWIDQKSNDIIQNMGFNPVDVLLDTDQLINKYVESQANSELSLTQEIENIEILLNEIVEKSKSIDPTLAKAFIAENVKITKSISQMESRMKRAEKQKHEVSINRIRKIKSKLFPENSLQERKDNFIPFFLKYGPEYFNLLLEHLNPLNKNFVILSEE